MYRRTNGCIIMHVYTSVNELKRIVLMVRCCYGRIMCFTEFVLFMTIS